MQWARFSPATQEKLVSAWHTFTATFVTVVIVTISTGTIEWSWAFFGGILLSAVRQAAKSAWILIAPSSPLAGVKGK